MTLAGPMQARQSLSRPDCLVLLASGGHGRVAASMRAVPVIIPVKFRLLGEEVVFDPDSAESYSSAVAGCVVAFQADGLGSDGQPGWDVHVTGVATALSSGTQPAGFRLSSEIMAGWRIGD